jgi:hypothetical protein
MDSFTRGWACMSNRTNYHLTILNSNSDFYFHYDGIIATGEILRIGGYRTVISRKKYDSPYIELVAKLVNEGETVIQRSDLR